MATYKILNQYDDTNIDYLINKFSSTGRVKVRAVSVGGVGQKAKFIIQLYMDSQDMYEHLLKPSAPYAVLTSDAIYKNDNQVVVFPSLFPNGIINQVSFYVPDGSTVQSFDIAVYGNNVNEFVGSTQWFRVTNNQMKSDGNSGIETFTYTNGGGVDVIPYDFNFVVMKITSTGSGIIGKTLKSNQERFKTSDTIFALPTSFSFQTETIPTLTDKQNLYVHPVHPYVQFNVVKDK